jgi:uncharacterized protein involved in exopolysaccharide biosynthesis
MSTDDATTIDVGAWFATLLRNWWVILGLVVIGAVVGGAVTMASPKEYSASSSVYIGQTTDSNGNPIAGLSSNSKAAAELLASQELLNEAVQKTGMKISAGTLRKETTIETPSTTIKTSTSVVNVIVITVTDSNKKRAAAAANALAVVLLARIDPGVNEKIALLDQQLATGQKALAASVARSTASQAGLTAIARGGGSAAEKAAASAPYVAIVQAAATEQEALVAANQKTALMLITAHQVEQPRLLHAAAVPDSPSGPSVTLNVAAGALAGLVIGIIVAFVRRRLTEHGTPQT